MATANPLEDHITCSICFEIYDDPHVLKECLHTFCRQCLRKLEKRNRVQCPECRVFTNKRSIKKDFKLQGVIESVVQAQQMQEQITVPNGDSLQNQKKTGEVRHMVCEWCKEVENPLNSYCIQCEKYFCNECVRRHSRIEACKSHKLKQVQDIAKIAVQEFQILIEKMTNLKIEIDEKVLLSDRSMREIGESEKQQLNDLNVQTNDAISQLKENQQLVTDIIKDVDGNVLQSLKQGKAVLLQSKEQLDEYIAACSEKIAQVQIMPPVEHANISTITLVESDVDRITTYMAALNCDAGSPIKLQRNSSWNVKDMIKIDMTGNMQLRNVGPERTVGLNPLTDNMQMTNMCLQNTSTGDYQIRSNDETNGNALINSGIPFSNIINDTDINTGSVATSVSQTGYTESESVENLTSSSDPNPRINRPNVENPASSSDPNPSGNCRNEDDSEPSIIPRQRALCLYSQLHMSKYDTVEDSLMLNPGYGPRLLRKVNNEIWCCNGNCLLITDLKLNVKRTLNFYPVDLSGFTHTHTGSIVLSCLSRNHGLLEVTNEGKYLNQVTEGSFSDVCHYNNKIYTLEKYQSELRQSKILVFSYNRLWSQIREINLDYQNTDLWDSLCVNRTGVYVTSWQNKAIYVYSLDYVLKYQIKKPMNNLIVCGVDDAGNILFVDYYKRQVKLYTCDGLWHDLDMPLERNHVAYPMYALYGDDKQEMWLTFKTFGCINHMEKYCLSETCV